MKTVTARTANQNFAKVLSDVEKGETIRITKHGRTVAELRPCDSDRSRDPRWRAAYRKMVKLMRETPETGFRVGRITEDDKYGDAPE